MDSDHRHLSNARAHVNECTYTQRLEDTVENALVKVVLTRAPGIDGIGNHAQDGLDALFLAEVEIEAPAEVFDNLGTGVKAGTSAGAHHLHEEHDAFGVYASKASERRPSTSVSITSKYSLVSLNGLDSKLMPPGDVESMKPKSM